MKFQQLDCLAAVADTGSLHGAAEKLSFSGQLISKHIEQLEQELGHALVYRDNSDMYLTQTGQQVMHYAREILKNRDALYADLDTNIEY